MKKYVFRKYTSKYSAFFALEKRRLNRLFSPYVKIEHVGSTAVPHLGGKGILDILIGVPKHKLKETKEKLEKSSYEFREKAGTSERLFFRKDYPYKRGKRRIHIHLTIFDGKDWKEIIAFRDYLVRNPNSVQAYIRLKKEAVKKANGDGEVYRKYKERFIKGIIGRSLKPLK